MKTQWLYKVSSAFMIVMLAIAALPVTPASAAVTSWYSPTNVQFTEWTNATNAFSSNDIRASETADGDEVIYNGFGITIPPGYVINGIEVSLEGYTSTFRDVDVELSWTDTGNNWTNNEFVDFTANSSSDETIVVGGPTDTWGENWSLAEISVLRVRIINDNDSGTFFLDHVQVRVYYDLPPEINVQGNATTINDGDNSPSTTDWTDFGNVAQGVPVDRTFTIQNTGTGDLLIGAITFTGGENGDFNVVSAPATTVAPGGSTTFTVRLTAGGGGGMGSTVRNTTVNIASNDSSENPYNFDIQGTRVTTTTEINVQGNATNITDNDGTPAAVDCTSFGSVALGSSVDCVYTIQNLGASVLFVGPVALGGASAADYSVVVSPASSVAASGSTTFTVRFTPSVAGARNAAISFANNDAGENPYNWNIQGTGINLVTPNLSISNSPVTFNGLQQAANVTCSSLGAVSNVRYDGSLTAPTNAGTYAVTADCVAMPGFTALTNASAGSFVISQAPSTVTVSCPLVDQPFTGSAQTPCTAEATGAGMTPVDVTASISYSNNINAGAATANASWAGDVNHTGNTGAGGFTISQVSSTVTVSCPLASQPYTGAAQAPCTAEATGVGMTPVDVTASISYSNNTNAGAATANASWAGDANHTGNTGVGGFTISQVSSTVTVSCPLASQPYTGAAQVPCTAEATGVGMIPVDVTASLVYSNNTNAGAATANASWAGDVNHTGNTGSGGFTISQVSSTVTVTCPVVDQPFTGSAQTPCTAEATGVGMAPVDVTASLFYSNNTNAGAATANASWAGDANHTGNTGAGGFTISQASSTLTVSCPLVNQPYTGSAQTPCTAEATGVGMAPVDVTASLVYSNNTNVGAATANASWAGDANHTGNAGAGGFTISQASSTVTVSCPLVNQPYTGSAQTPCTAEATGVGMAPVDVTASLVYSNNTNAGAATANASWAGDANHTGNTGAGGFTISQVSSTVTVSCPLASLPYTGSAQTPCTAEATGISMTPVDVTASIVYSNNINAGAATANASWAGDVNHTGNTGAGGFTISQVSSIVTLTCPVVDQPFTGSAQTPCTAEATGVGMTPVDITASIVYSNNINVGMATANVTWPGDINHTGNTDSGGFVIGQAISTVTVSCPASVAYTGAALTPCTAEATGAGMTPVDVTASLVYSNNTNVGTATADASWAGDVSHTGDTGSNTFNITPAAQSITVTTSAPATASNGSTFSVAATADSGLTVSITVSGVCTVVDNGNGTADITMTSGTGTCSIFYDQAGDSNYSAATQVQEDVTATEGPSFTSANNASFDMGFPGSFTVTAVGNPMIMTITSTGSLPTGVTLTDNGDGTATLAGTPAAGTNGTYNLVFTANNSILPNGTQNFTLSVRNGPIVSPNGVNSVPDTGNGNVGENESILDTLGLTQLTVEFSQDVYNPAGDTDQDDVTNPANYVLVRSTTASFATVSCADGAKAPDVQISVDSVSYSNGGGTGPFVSTLSINGGFPLNVVGFYRLYVCGTTSIVDANNTGLVLAGNGTTPGTDFQRNFRIVTQVSGGGGGGGGASSTSSTLVTGGFLIPVTGFAPNQVTTLPAQPADKAYTSMGQMTIEIPTLGVKFPIVGAAISNKTWDLTWLNSVAYLEGSAYPTTAGNTVLTAHVQDASNNIGPFSDIKGMTVGQNIYIHVNGQTYVYQVQESRKVSPSSVTTIFKHEEDSWVTLVTCEDFNAKTGVYASRRMVRAVLISVIPTKK